MKSPQIIFLLLLAIFISCSKDENIKTENEPPFIKPKNGGVIITFDDNYVNEWYSLCEYLKEKKYNWKGTFCISQMKDFDNDFFDKIIQMKNDGHEISGHGLKHINSVDYVSENGLDSYVSDEIKPMIDIFDKKGVKLESFAYPYGSRDSTIDKELFKYFKVLRGTSYGLPEPSEKFRAFVGESTLVYGIGIDKTYERPFSYLTKVLDYARDNNKVLILYAHKPINSEQLQDFDVSFSRIDSLCTYVRSNEMNFYTLSDVPKLIAK